MPKPWVGADRSQGLVKLLAIDVKSMQPQVSPV
jgi:hypothetical protein